MTPPYDLIIHAGAPKTGSSSIQRALSHNPDLSGPGGNFRYIAIGWNGDIVSGSEIAATARQNAYDYVQSFHELAQIGLSEAASESLADMRDVGIVPILSQEDWFRQSHKAADLLKAFRRAHVVIYVRPHLEWFNAAWFQWLRWDDEFKTPADVVAKWAPGFVKFAKAGHGWKSVPGVAKVSVRLLPRDVVADFCDLIGVDRPAINGNVNTSLDLPLIKLIDMLGGRTRHAAAIDFRLARYFSAERKPWAIDRACGERILPLVKDDTKALIDLLPAEQASQVVDDPRWWTFSPYEDRPIADEASELTRDECIALLRQAARAILSIDEEQRPG